jgi:hypothetical protein
MWLNCKIKNSAADFFSISIRNVKSRKSFLQLIMLNDAGWGLNVVLSYLISRGCCQNKIWLLQRFCRYPYLVKPVKLGLLCSDGGKSKICFITVLVQRCFIDYFSDALSIDGVSAYLAIMHWTLLPKMLKDLCLHRKVYLA